MSTLQYEYYNKILTFFSSLDNFFHAAEHSRSVSAYGTGVGEVSFVFFTLSIMNLTKPVKGLFVGGERSFFKTLEKDERYQG